jgi:type 1 fimbriae regulatory protein FimB
MRAYIDQRPTQPVIIVAGNDEKEVRKPLYGFSDFWRKVRSRADDILIRNAGASRVDICSTTGEVIRSIQRDAPEPVAQEKIETKKSKPKKKAKTNESKTRATVREERAARIKYLSHDQVKAFFSVIDVPRDRAMFLILYRRGLRASEVGMLELSDVDMNAGYITVNRLKGSLAGRFKLLADEMKALRRYLRTRSDSSRFLFPNRYGHQLTRAGVYGLMRKYGELAGLPRVLQHPHCLKHSIATHLLEAGADLRLVQDALGHKEIENTVIYTAIANPVRDQKQRELYYKMPKF